MNKMLLVFYSLCFIFISMDTTVHGMAIDEEFVGESVDFTEETVGLSCLSIECQLLIIEKMDLYSLVSIAQTSNHFHDLALDVFQRKHASKTISFGFLLDRNLTESFLEGSQIIVLQNRNMIFIFLRTFGHLIKDLDLRFRGESLDAQIHQTIVKYCSNSLISIRFDRPIDQICMSKFNTVEILEISNGDLKSSEISQRLNNTFPNLKQLNFYRNIAFDTNALNIKFPFLERVEIQFLYTGDSHFENAMENLFIENPQVKSIVLHSETIDFLKTVSKRLPNLKRLELHWLSINDHYTDDRIDFNNVKMLRIVCDRYSSWEILHFERLEELKISSSDSGCFNLILQNNNLTKLTVQNDLKQSEVIQLENQFRNLEELSLGCKSDVETDTLINLIELNKNLRKFSLNEYTTYTFDDKSYKFDDKLRNHFYTGWKWHANSMVRI